MNVEVYIELLSSLVYKLVAALYFECSGVHRAFISLVYKLVAALYFECRGIYVYYTYK